MILIVDDDSTIRISLKHLLRREGYETEQAATPAEAIDIVRRQLPQLVLMDMNYSRETDGREGLDLLARLRVLAPGVPIILMTAWGSIDLAVAGMRAGAFDFVTKPWNMNRLLDTIAGAISLKSTQQSSETGNFDRGDIVGQSKELAKVLDTAARVAPTSAPVLITGESGTGKELIAEAIHRNSPRRDRPFVKVNLGGISQSLFESEMFGYRKGAFTGAVTDRAGRFEAADGGTIFLDEIGELDSASQVKMLRVLQEQTFEPLGTNETRHVDVRIICATNADLSAMVAARTFREDLFYRINLVSLELPPLRQRPDDIGPLARYFCAQLCKSNPALGAIRISDDAVDYLRTRHFPGNIRELKNLVERTALLSEGPELHEADFRTYAGNENSSAPASDGTLDSIEKARIQAALIDAGGKVSAAAAALGLTRQALYRRMAKYGLQ